MRHLSPCRAAREVLLLPAFVIDPPRRALLVLGARPPHPLSASHRRTRWAVPVAPITAAADPHRHLQRAHVKTRASAAATTPAF